MSAFTNAATSGSSGAPQIGREIVRVVVNYLPAPEPFRQTFNDETSLATVRADATAFFHVTDHKDRDQHEFFLEFDGRRLTNLNETLGQLLGPHRREANFNLIEQITKGGLVE